MDIFVVHGHLVSFGANREWLDVGADGEYLLDTRRPYHSENLAPDRLWLSDRQTLEQILRDQSLPSTLRRLAVDIISGACYNSCIWRRSSVQDVGHAKT